MRLFRRMRMRTVAIMAAVLVAGAGLPIVATALPAQAVSCTYGDQFWVFVSDWTGDVFNYGYGGSPAGEVVNDSGSNLISDGTPFCQVVTGSWGRAPDGHPWSEWVAKNTDLCMTDTTGSDGSNYVYMKTCANTGSQQWDLYDNLPGNPEWWGGILNHDTAPGYPCAEAMFDYLRGFQIDDTYCWSQTQQWQVDLNGPYT